jgi:hypothetical protein
MPAEPKLVLAIDREPVVFAGSATARLAIENPLPHALALIGVEVHLGQTDVIRATLSSVLHATFTRDGAVVDGTMFVDDIGAQARLPSPPRWTWKGEPTLTTFAVLPPKAAVTFEGEIQVPSDGEARLDVRVHFAALSENRPLLHLAGHSLEGVTAGEPPSLFGSGWVPSVRAFATYAKGVRPRSPTTESLPWSRETGAHADDVFPGRAPALFSTAMRSKDFSEQARREARLERRVAVAAPALLLAEARKRAAIPTGRAAYSRALGAWFLEGDAGTTWVSPKEVRTLPGRLVELVERLNRREPQEVVLAVHAPEEEVRSLTAFLKSRGFDAVSSMEKGGLFGGTVKLNVRDLSKLAAALSERGLRVEGSGVAPAHR